MARLKFDLKPVDPWWTRDAETEADHNERIREFWARHYPGQEPEPCDCGYYAGGPHLTYCGPVERQRCRAQVKDRLEAHYRGRHKDALKAKRVFPGVPFPKAGRARCKWCNGPISLGRFKTRGWHDGRGDEPDCIGAYNLHTRLESQQIHLLKRDGLGCYTCGAVEGAWRKGRAQAPPPSWVAEGKWVAEFCFTEWCTGLEVDHFIALALAWEAFSTDERRRWFFSPRNLRALCPGCHKAKTREDTMLIRMAQERGPEWARAEVLRRLSDAGLLRPRQTEGGAHDQS